MIGTNLIGGHNLPPYLCTCQNIFGTDPHVPIQRGVRQQLQSCHRRGPKRVPAQTAEITKCHVIEIAGGDSINQFLLKIRAF